MAFRLYPPDLPPKNDFLAIQCGNTHPNTPFFVEFDGKCGCHGKNPNPLAKYRKICYNKGIIVLQVLPHRNSDVLCAVSITIFRR
jgi:hypothetical protein